MTQSLQPPQRDAAAAWQIEVDQQRTPAASPWLRDGLSWLTSLIVHGLILVVLGLWVAPHDDRLDQTRLDIAPGLVDEEEVEDLDPEALDQPEISVDVAGPAELQPVTEEEQPETEISSLDDLEPASLRVELDELSDRAALADDLLTEIGSVDVNNPLGGRSRAARGALVRAGGGTKGSERAVALALAWLAEHQNPDGSWSFQHQLGPCQGRCPNPGTVESAQNGATALALLPFLGAGQTHTQGKYQRTVAYGIGYLVRALAASTDGGLADKGGRLYSHGLATIALSEAYAMTKDKRLIAPAQQLLNFVVFAQDPRGGGWRYEPHQPGDTSVVGWQVMALKSGRMAYLNVPERTLRGATVFLNYVQQEGGAFYGYTDPNKARRSATTAVGLLCRMYLGWRHDNEALKRGVEWFSEKGPAENDFYANYYAMQVMFHYTGAKGPMWSKWNGALREQLIKTQDTQGHMRGSWFRPGGASGSNKSGGRLYCTAMATMILEVYYRHMPLYRQVLTEDDDDGYVDRPVDSAKNE